jgi:AraC family transcriptional regulator
MAILRRHAEFYGRSERKIATAGFSVTDMRPDPYLVVQRHTHDVAHFIFLMEGAYVTAARNAPLVCVRPTLIYNPPGTTHRDRFEALDGRVEGRFLAISVTAERMALLSDHIQLANQPVCLEHPDAITLAARLCRECRRWEPAAALVAEAICLELVAHTAARDLDDPISPPSWLSRARGMLRDCCADNLSVGDLARDCGVHPVYLARAFRRFFDCSPGEYSRRCRLERAAALLRGTRQSLGGIALASGFADQSHMSRSFRRAYAITPSEYRRVIGRPDISS